MNHSLIATAIQAENITENQVVATRVADAARDASLAELYSTLALTGGSTIYEKPDRLSPDDQSGYRDFYLPMNDGDRYPASAEDRTFQPAQPGSCFGGKVGVDESGVIATRHARFELSIDHPDSLHPKRPFVLGVIS